MFVTGSRAEYDILYPVIEAVSQSKSLRPGLVVTGSHLASVFGLTVKDVEADGYPIVAKIDNLLASDSDAARAKSAANPIARPCRRCCISATRFFGGGW